MTWLLCGEKVNNEGENKIAEKAVVLKKSQQEAKKLRGILSPSKNARVKLAKELSTDGHRKDAYRK